MNQSLVSCLQTKSISRGKSHHKIKATSQHRYDTHQKSPGKKHDTRGTSVSESESSGCDHSHSRERSESSKSSEHSASSNSSVGSLITSYHSASQASSHSSVCSGEKMRVRNRHKHCNIKEGLQVHIRVLS
ncbi:unnamed protein product [Heterobilharzia americana]|nr:unnamed protein product [Heterobilharzia americana]